MTFTKLICANILGATIFRCNMRLPVLASVLLMAFSTTPLLAAECSSLLDHEVRTLGDSNVVKLCDKYQGKVIMVVNTASKCAYTNQYESLEDLYTRYKDRGLVVLGFPSNDFGNQEPGTEQQIRTFCSVTYGVDFPMFAKTGVVKRNAHPFYADLAEASGTYPRWNFHKYLISAEGKLVASYQSAVDPLDDAVISEVENQLRSVRF